MRILHVVPSYIPAYRYGGPIYSVHGLCKALVALGHDVNVFTTNVDGDQDSDVPLEQPVDLDGVKVWYFPSRHLRRLYYSSSLLKTLNLRLNTFNIVHLHSIFLWPTWAAARVARKCGVPYLISPRGMLVEELIRRKSHFAKTIWITLREKRNLEGASAIHVTSKTEAADIAKFGFNLKKVVIVPNGIDMAVENHSGNDLSAHVREIVERVPYLLFLGRINWKKGLDRLILALKLVADIRLVIAGNDEDSYRPKLEKLAGNNELSDRVVFCGPVYGTDKVALLKAAQLFVLPSYSENFGNAVLEAMAEGCPIVVTPEVGVAELVRDAGAGIVVNGEPVVLGNGLRKLLADSKGLKEMGERGKKAVAEGYTWVAVAEQMEEVYEDIARRAAAQLHT